MRIRIKNLLELTAIGILLVGLLFGFANTATADDPYLAEVVMDPDTPTMQVGESVEFTASGKDQNGDPFPLSDPQWEGDTWHGTISVNPTGQSGHLMSKHYDDQAELFNKGRFRKQMMNREEIQATCSNILRLRPIN